MAGLTGDEPDLKLGDSGEGVVLLQVRLYGLGVYRTVPDGTFDMATENAVRELQSQGGQDNNGEVTRETWESILYWEQQAGIQYQYSSPYDALSQLSYDLQHPETASGRVPASQGVGQVSDDGQWQWDGFGWQATNGGAAQQAGDGYAGQLSEDGQWQWDGVDWQPAHGEAVQQYAAAGQQSAAGDTGQLSEDGQWRWDGGEWHPASADSHLGQVSDDGRWRWDGNEWQVA